MDSKIKDNYVSRVVRNYIRNEKKKIKNNKLLYYLKVISQKLINFDFEKGGKYMCSRILVQNVKTVNLSILLP